MGEIILTMKNISKSFSGVAALKNGELTLEAGEVVALMGENGAGKSTLMKILTGIYDKDGGTITYMGNEVEFKGPAASEKAGIAIVHQELNMMSDLTVAQNLFIGKECMKGLFIDDALMVEKAKALFDVLNIDIDPAERIGALTVGKQQMVEIAKAISGNAKIIIFDEPTAALTDSEIEELFKVIRDLKKKGTGIVYISHRMDEINVISDKVTVMRDGEFVGTLVTKDCDKNDIIKTNSGNDVIIGNKGDDILISRFGNDTYIFNLGDGNDTIIDNKGKDTIKFNGDIKNLNFTKIADDLVIKYSLKDSVTIKDHFKNRRNNISKIEFNNNSYIKDLHNITKELNQDNIVNNNNLDKNNLSNLNKNLTVNLDNNINSFISQSQINKIIQDLNSYNNDNAINLNFSSEFKNNDIMQLYNG